MAARGPDDGNDPDEGIAQIGRAGFRIAMVLVLPGAVLLLLEPRDSPAFVISAITCGLGIVLAACVLLLTWLAHRRHRHR
ncbi:MAG TPA: hypothetical protein VNP95_03690 [Thermomicrobiales bacterium]|jgi:hypothetical protein|nr:hypothetical protein [Thermomicrobiales bacterium]